MEGGEDPETEKHAEFVPSTRVPLKSRVTSIMVEMGPENKLEGRLCAFFLHDPSLCKHSIHQVKLCKKVTKQWPQKMLLVKNPMANLSDPEMSYLPSF